MSSIPEGDLSRVVSGIADSMAVTGAGNVSAPAGQMASEMVRDVAARIEQALNEVFGNLHKHSPNATEAVRYPSFDPTPTRTPFSGRRYVSQGTD